MRSLACGMRHVRHRRRKHWERALVACIVIYFVQCGDLQSVDVLFLIALSSESSL